jgi:hypothetical protein
LDWTNLGSANIIGVQGSYYLILVPFALLLVQRLGAWLNHRVGWRYKADAASMILSLPAIIMALKGAALLPTLVIWSFYQ